MRASKKAGDPDNFTAYVHRIMESLWLLAVIASALAVSPADWMLSYIQMPKVVLLRILVSLMVILWVLEWAISSKSSVLPRPILTWTTLKLWASREPTRWLTIAVGVFLATYVLSTLLSSSFRISVWGRSAGEDGYSLYNMLTYFLLFLVVATHLRSKPQLWRLLIVIACVGAITSGIGVLQRLGIDALALRTDPLNRIGATFGNSIFMGAFLVMTIPISLAVLLYLERRFQNKSIAAFWTIPFTLQLVAIELTLSRGPWIGLTASLAVFILIGLKALNKRSLAVAGITLGLSLGVSIAVIQALPTSSNNSVIADNSAITYTTDDIVVSSPSTDSSVPSSVSSSIRSDNPLSPPASPSTTVALPSVTIDITNVEAIEERLASIPAEVASGALNTRISIWRASGRLIIERPWFPFDELPLAVLRPLVGYGPELFSYVYPLEALPETGLASQAHNHIIHEAVELGYMGVLAYLAMLTVFFAVTAKLLFSNRLTFSWEHRLILVVLASTICGHVVEQMVGIARVSDFTLFWVLLATFVALPNVMRTPGNEQRVVSKRSRARDSQLPILRLSAVLAVAVTLGVLGWNQNVSLILADVSTARAYRAYDYQEAISLMDAAISLAPSVPNYYESRGDFLSRLNSNDAEVRADLAERIYIDRKLALEADALSVIARLKLANAALNLARLGYEGLGEEAAQRYRELISMTPNLGELHQRPNILLAITYLRIGRYDESLEVIENLLATDLQGLLEPNTLYLQGVSYYGLGMSDEAIASLEQSLGAGGELINRAEVHALLAKIYCQLGEDVASEKHYNQYKKITDGPEPRCGQN